MARSALQIAAFDAARLRRETMLLGQHRFLCDWAVNDPEATAGFIEFDQPTVVPYPFPHTEMHYAISGSAEYRSTAFPAHEDERVDIVQAGSLCLIRFGSTVNITPLESPYRVAWVVMPPPPTPYQQEDA